MASNYRTIAVERVTPTIGAVVSGVDLSKPVSAEQFGEIQDAFHENLVLLFKDQDLDVDQFRSFGQRFGPLHIHPMKSIALEGYPEVTEIKADENSTFIGGELWHQDTTSETEPLAAIMLHMHETPEGGGGDTLFASAYAAYDALSEPMKQMLDGLTAVHEFSHGARQYVEKDRRSPEVTLSEKREVPMQMAVHPVVRTHPVTKRKALFVNRVFTTRIVGLGYHESRAILEFLFSHVEQDEFKCRIKWQPKSLALWDNRATYHRVIWDFHPHRRYGVRITICGSRPE